MLTLSHFEKDFFKNKNSYWSLFSFALTSIVFFTKDLLDSKIKNTIFSDLSFPTLKMRVRSLKTNHK